MLSQWLFPLSALSTTPTRETSGIALAHELRERAKGIEFLFRVAAQLGLPNSVFCAAAQYFHRFYMRFSMEDYPRQEVAAASIFLATKTEENSRKLKDVSYVCYSKATGGTDETSPEVHRWQKNILATEEILLDALCFDFIVDHPQAELIDLLVAFNAGESLEQYSWTLVNDSLRTPLCILHPSRIIATACFILAQKLEEGPGSASLDERIFSRSSASLPTPPHLHSRSPQSANFAQGFFQLSESDMEAVAFSVTILLDFYSSHATLDDKDLHLRPLTEVLPLALEVLAEKSSVDPQIAHPSLPSQYTGLYHNNNPAPQTNYTNEYVASPNDGGITPASMSRTPHRSGCTPVQDKSPTVVNGSTTPSCDSTTQHENAEVKPAPRRGPPLDLS